MLKFVDFRFHFIRFSKSTSEAVIIYVITLVAWLVRHFEDCLICGERYSFIESFLTIPIVNMGRWCALLLGLPPLLHIFTFDLFRIQRILRIYASIAHALRFENFEII